LKRALALPAKQRVKIASLSTACHGLDGGDLVEDSGVFDKVVSFLRFGAASSSAAKPPQRVINLR